MSDHAMIWKLADAGWTVEQTTQRGHALWRATRPGWVRSAPTLEDLARDCERVPPLLALDLFAGRGGATAAMRDRGWRVIRVDNDPAMCPDVLADLATWSYDGPRPDLIWASPPCQEFARESMPWSRTGQTPSLDLVRAAIRIIREVQPRFWAIENVRGAVRYLTPLLGKPQRLGPWYIWGNLPLLPRRFQWHAKERFSSQRPDLRALIPYHISLAVAVMVETQRTMVTTGVFDAGERRQTNESGSTCAASTRRRLERGADDSAGSGMLHG